MCFSAVLGLGSSLIGASSASKAAKAQKEAADAQVELSREVYNDQKTLFAPFLGAGTNALNAYLYEMGLGEAPTVGGAIPTITSFTETTPGTTSSWTGAYDDNNPTTKTDPVTTTKWRVGDNEFATEAEAQSYAQANPTGGTTYGGYTKTPGYDFRLNEGLGALERGAAAQGGLFSGNAMKSALQYGQDYATNEYGNYLSRLSAMASSGQNAAGMQGAAAQNYGATSAQALSNYGNAAAAGHIGVGNALQGGLQNMAGYWGYQNANSGNTGSLNDLFNGSWKIG